MVQRRHVDVLGLPSQPGLRIAFTLMTSYLLYVPVWSRRFVEVFFTLQSLLLLLLWVSLHVCFLSYPTVCLEQSNLVPLLSHLSGTDVLRLSLWLNHTIPVISTDSEDNSCHNPNYKTIIQTFSQKTCPSRATHKSQDMLYYLLSQYQLLEDELWSEDTNQLSLQHTDFTPYNETHLLVSTLLESMEFCSLEGILKLPHVIRDKLGVNTTRLDLDYFTADCTQVSLGFLPVAALVGYDQILMQSFRHLSKHYFNSSGYVLDLRSREIYRFYAAYFDRMLLLFAFFPILIIALMSSNLLWFCHVILHHMIIFMRFTADHMAPIFMSLATLTLLYALFGIFAVMTGLLNDDGPLCLIVMLAIFSADQYYLIFCNHPVSKRQWPKFFYLFLFVFVAYYLRFNGQLFLYAFLTCYTLLTLSMIYFMHSWELVLVQRAMIQAGLTQGNNSTQRFKTAFRKYQLLLGQLNRPIHQLIQVEIQVGPVMAAPPMPPQPPVPPVAASDTQQ